MALTGLLAGLSPTYLMLVLSLALIAGLPGSVSAQDLVIKNARILDGVGGVIPNGTIVIRNGRILSVSEQPAEAEDAEVINAAGMTVMPGFIDSHRHIIDGNPQHWLETRAVEEMRAFIEAGFTTVFSAGDPLEAILELRRRLAAGDILGPRLIVAGRVPLAQSSGPPGPPGADPARFDVSRPPDRPTEPAEAIPHEETRAQVRRLAEAGVDAIKTVMIATPGGPETETLSVIVDEAGKHGLPTVTHAVSIQDMMAAVEAGTTSLAHTPHIGRFDETRRPDMVAAAGVPMMSTLGVFVPRFDDNNRPIFRDGGPFPMNTLSSAGQGPVNARRLWEAGVTYGFGTDTRFPPKESLAHELRSLRPVFSRQDIVKIMGRNAAATLGMEREIGTLSPGKRADIVMIDGDPLTDTDDLLNVEVVIKKGAIVVDKR